MKNFSARCWMHLAIWRRSGVERGNMIWDFMSLSYGSLQFHFHFKGKTIRRSGYARQPFDKLRPGLIWRT
jgi:hypothetical protein